MTVRAKIFIFIAVVMLCLLAQAYDQYKGTGHTLQNPPILAD